MAKQYKDYHILIVLLLISFTSVYFLPAIFNRIVFLVILVSVARTRVDYVYLVWFFIINNAPGRLFSAGALDAARIPLYPITQGFSITFQELFLLLYLLKFLTMKRPFKFIFKKEFTLFFIFALFVVLYSLPLGISFTNMVITFRSLFPWAMVFIIPAYFYNREIMIRVSLLLFPFVFLALLSQIYTYITGNYLDYYLRGTQFNLFSLQKEAVSRSYSSVYITLFSIIQSLYFFFTRKSEINKNYLGLVVFVGYFSILLTSTRGWIIAVSALLLGVLILSGFSRAIIKWIRMAIVFIAVFWIATSQSSLIQRQVDSSFQRLATLEALASGDLTAEGTLKRLDVRSPRVMNKFWESPILGWGFSNEYYDYHDRHVGNQSILLNIGILGFIFINGLFILLCIKIWKLARIKKIQIYEGFAPSVYVLGLIAVFIIHATSTQFWGYSLSKEQTLFFGFLFAAVNAVFLYRERPGQ